MRLVILTQYFLPETGAPQNRLSDLAQRLRAMGHDVRVLTALPNYPLGRVFTEYRGKMVQRRNLDGIPVIHCWLYPSRSRSTPLRLLSFMSFVFSSMLLGALLLPRSDVLLVESPPIFLGIAAKWLSIVKRAKLVFNVSDLYPETAIALGYLNSRLLQRLLYAFEAWCYRNAVLVTGQTKGIVASIRSRFTNKLVYLLTNGVDMARFDASAACSGNTATFDVGYAGVLGHAQKLETILDTANLLMVDHPNVRFLLYGDGPMKEVLQSKATAMGLTNVVFNGHLGHEDVLKEMRRWQAGVVPLANAKLLAGALPSKMFEVMATGIPVILSTPRGEASELVETANAGVWVPAESPCLLSEKIAWLVSDRALCAEMGRNGRSLVIEHYDRANIARRFAEFLTESGIIEADD